MIPEDPFILLSFVNLKLRDYYENLDVLCEELDVSKEELIEKLKMIHYEYHEKENRFV
jgi:Domain of unknown function (DUF4250)